MRALVFTFLYSILTLFTADATHIQWGFYLVITLSLLSQSEFSFSLIVIYYSRLMSTNNILYFIRCYHNARYVAIYLTRIKSFYIQLVYPRQGGIPTATPLRPRAFSFTVSHLSCAIQNYQPRYRVALLPNRNKTRTLYVLIGFLICCLSLCKQHLQVRFILRNQSLITENFRDCHLASSIQAQ